MAVIDRMYPHTVTIYTKLREVDGKATWKRTVLEGVRYSDSVGYQRAPGGDRGTSSAFLVVPADSLRGYVHPVDFTGAGWTLRPRDTVCFGSITTEDPPKQARCVNEAKVVMIASSIHHLEVS